jgi:hypothetical protein
MRHCLFFGPAIAALVVFSIPAFAQGNSGRNNGAQGRSDPPIVQQIQDILSAEERDIIADFFRTNETDLPPGLARRQSLPPGLARQLERNGTLPPGLSTSGMPAALRSQLPGRTEDVTIIGSDVILVDIATRVIVDIIHDVFLGR